MSISFFTWYFGQFLGDPVMKLRLILIISLTISAVLQAEMKDRKETACIIIHHSATIQGNVEIFQRCHRERGWEDIGYHFVITNGNSGPDGEIQIGRPLEKIGAHAKGRNHNSVGICLVGEDQFTAKQKDSLIRLLAKLCAEYNLEISEKTIQAHHERCPGQGLTFDD